MHNENTLPPEFRSATGLIGLLRERKLGALELLDLQLARVARNNPQLNAIVAMDIERARADARAADNVAATMREPLHGLPITIKDAYEVTGMPMGLQAVGPYLEDRTPLRFAQLVEQALGGYVPPPAMVSG